MTDFDIENVEWRDGGRGPRNLKELWDLEADCYPEDLDLIPASAYRKAVEEIGRLEKGREVERAMLRGAMSRIKELEAECREWKEQCEKGDAKLVRECEEWREQCARLGEAAPTALGVPDGNLKIARRDQTIANLQGRIDAMEARRDRANFDEVTVNWGCLASVVGFAEDIYGREGRDQPPKTVRILRAALDDVENRRRAFTGTAARGEAPHKQCSGCEGSPSGDNDPCGVCQTRSVSPIEKAADDLAEAVENFGGADSLEEATDAYDLRVMPALSNYLKVKEGK